jgi:hypothetical protein
LNYRPERGSFAPTTQKPLDPSLVIPTTQKGPIAFVEIKHSLQVRIELRGLFTPITLECACHLASVSRRDCENVLDEFPGIMPSLDYEKLFGDAVWLPTVNLKFEVIYLF